MIDINEILAEFFQKRPEPDADGFFQYLYGLPLSDLSIVQLR